MNRTKTLMLLAALTALLLWAGQALAGQAGLVIALVLALVLNLGSYWFSDKMVLRMYGAQEVDENDAAQLHAMVREFAARSDIPTPRSTSFLKKRPMHLPRAGIRNMQRSPLQLASCGSWNGGNSPE